MDVLVVVDAQDVKDVLVVVDAQDVLVAQDVLAVVDVQDVLVVLVVPVAARELVIEAVKIQLKPQIIMQYKQCQSFF